MNVTIYRNKHGKAISGRVSVYGGKDENGKEIRLRKTFKVPHDKQAPSKAKKYLIAKGIEFEKECRKNSDNTEPEHMPTFEEYVEAWKQKKIAAKKIKASTLARYEEIIDRINDEFGGKPLSSITSTTLGDFYTKLSSPGANKKTGGPLSPKTVKEHHIIISSVFSRAVKYEIISSNPAELAAEDLPDVTRPHVEIFDPEELRELLDLAELEQLKWCTLINVLATTGLRRGEVLGLRWEDVDIDNKTPVIRVRNTILYTKEKGIYVDTPKTAASVRTIRINNDLATRLKIYREWQMHEKEKYGDSYIDNGFLFTTVLGHNMHPDTVTGYLQKFRKKYSLSYNTNPHKFRHTVASILIYKGIDIVTVSAYLGHNDPSVTAKVYAHLIKDALAKASDAISEVLLE